MTSPIEIYRLLGKAGDARTEGIFSEYDTIFSELEDWVDKRDATISVLPYIPERQRGRYKWIRAKVMMPSGEERRVYYNINRWDYADSGKAYEREYKKTHRLSRSKEAIKRRQEELKEAKKITLELARSREESIDDN